MPRSLDLLVFGAFLALLGRSLARSYRKVSEWPKWVVRSPSSTPTLEEWKRKNVLGARIMERAGVALLLVGLVLVAVDGVPF